MNTTTPQNDDSMDFDFDKQHIQHSYNSSIMELVNFLFGNGYNTLQECNLPILNLKLDGAIEQFGDFDNICINHSSFGPKWNISPPISLLLISQLMKHPFVPLLIIRDIHILHPYHSIIAS